MTIFKEEIVRELQIHKLDLHLYCAYTSIPFVRQTTLKPMSDIIIRVFSFVWFALTCTTHKKHWAGYQNPEPFVWFVFVHKIPRTPNRIKYKVVGTTHHEIKKYIERVRKI